MDQTAALPAAFTSGRCWRAALVPWVLDSSSPGVLLTDAMVARLQIELAMFKVSRCDHVGGRDHEAVHERSTRLEAVVPRCRPRP